METQLVPQQEARPLSQERLTAANLKADFDLIMQVMKAVMNEGMDYGIIKGCQKPSLWKPGAEKLNVAFRLNGKPQIDDLSTPDEARYRVISEFIHIPTGQSIGFGVGEASSDEEKYKWRKSVSPAEWDATPEDRRRLKYYAEGNPVKQVRTNVADIRNTILKMADKRSYVSGTLKCTAASSVFTQDLEDLNDDLRAVVADDERATVQPVTTPKAKDTPAATAPTPQPNGAAQTETKPAANGPDTSTLRKMTSRFPGKCEGCDGEIAKGTEIFYDGDRKVAYHSACVGTGS